MESTQEELNERLDRIEQKLNDIVQFCETVTMAVNGLAKGGGMSGMMARQMLPPELLTAMSGRVNGSALQ